MQVTVSGLYILELNNVFTALANQYLEEGKQISFLASGIPEFSSGYIGKLLFEDITQTLYIGGSGSWKQLCKYSELTQTSGFLQSGYIAADLALSGTLTTSIASASGTLNTKIDNVSGALYNQIWASGSIVTAIDTASGAAVTNAVGQAQTIITNASGVLNTKIDNTSGTLNNKIWASGSIVTAIANASGAAVTTANTNTTNVSGALYNQIWASGSIVTAIANASGAAVLTASGIADQLYAPKVVYGSGLPSPGISGLFFMDHSDRLYPDFFGPTLYIGIANPDDPYEREWLEIVDSTKLARELDSALSYYASITLLNSTSGYLESYTNSTVNIVLNASKAYTDNKILNLNMLASGLSMVMGPVYKPNQIKPLFVTAQYENIVSSTNGVISVGGGNSAYPAWQLIGENYNIPTSNWYLRSGQDETWGTPYRIWHSGDFSQTNVNTWNGLQTVITNASGTLNTKIDNASGTLNTKIDNVSGALKAQIWTSGSIVTAIASASGAAVTNAVGQANTALTNASGTLNTKINNIDYINIEDIRGTNPVPSSYDSKKVTAQFNNQWGGTWRAGLTVAGWSTLEGYSAWQFIGGANVGSTEENWYLRSGREANWNIWRRVWHDGDFTSTSVSNWNAASGWVTGSGLFLKKDGTTPLTAAWNVGNNIITSSGGFVSTKLGAGFVLKQTASNPLGNMWVDFQNINGTELGYVGYADTDSSMYIRNVSGNLLLQHVGTWNVAVGTTATPVSKLDVSGVITASGGNSTNWNAAYNASRQTSVFYPFPKGLTDHAASFASGTYGRVMFSVPSDFISLNSLKLICVPLVTASGNRRVRIDFLYGKPGESFTQHESSEYHTIDFGLDKIKQSIEISGYLPASLEALDTGYVFIGHMTDGAIPPPTGVTHYYGIELNYNKY